MRITNTMMIDRVVTNLNAGLNKTNNYNMQLSTNRKITRLSDDPVGVMSSMMARQNIHQIQRYQDSCTTARSWVDQTETAIMDIEQILISVRENLISAISTTTDEDKYNIGLSIESMRDHIFQTMNASVNGKFLFAGFNTTNAPFVQDGNDVLYNGINLINGDADAIQTESEQILEFEIGYQMNMQVTFTGVEVARTGDKNMFKILDELVAALKGDGRATASNEELSNTFLEPVEELRSHIMSIGVVIGSRTNTLDMMDNRYSQDYINYEAMRTNIEEPDQAETIMNMKFSEAVYQQALAVGARIIQPTLMDFLR